MRLPVTKRLRKRIVIVVVVALTIFSIGYDSLGIRVFAPIGSVTTKATLTSKGNSKGNGININHGHNTTNRVPAHTDINKTRNRSKASSDLWNTTTKTQDKASKSGAETEKAETETAAPENDGAAGVVESGENKGNVSAFGDSTTNTSEGGGGESEQTSTSRDGSTEEAEPVITLLVMLSGEFGNNMFKILRGWGTAMLAWEEFGLFTRLVFAEQRSRRGGVMGKAKASTKHLQKCFASPSYFRTGDFGLGNKLLDKGYFHELQIPDPNFTLSDDNATIDTIKANLKILSDYLGDNPELLARNEHENNTTTATHTQPIIPRIMVRVNSLHIYPIVNEFYETIRNTFVFDDELCCGETLEDPPGEDESVLHLRNYATEMKESRRKSLGFEEIDEGRLVSEVLGHLKEGDKLALAGRNLEKDTHNYTTEAYSLVSALRAKNLTLRFTPGSDSMADFCFLKQTRKELIGSSMSTYFELAAYLGGPSLTNARMYQYVTPNVSRPSGSRLDIFRRTVGSNWTHPELRARIRFEEYL